MPHSLETYHGKGPFGLSLFKTNPLSLLNQKHSTDEDTQAWNKASPGSGGARFIVPAPTTVAPEGPGHDLGTDDMGCRDQLSAHVQLAHTWVPSVGPPDPHQLQSRVTTQVEVSNMAALGSNHSK